MRAVRRLYFYLVAFISVEVILWGVISLLRTVFEPAPFGGGADILAGGLAAVLVGLPVFLLHWLVVQRDAARSPEEKTSQVRALFLYGIRLALLIPIAQSLVALANRLLLAAFELDSTFALVGGDQSYADNLAALAVLVPALAYFERVLHDDLASPGENLITTRRLFRYAWMLYALALLVIGVINLFRFILTRPFPLMAGQSGAEWLAGGIALILVGAPLWARAWHTVQSAQPDPQEAGSTLRLVVLYGLTLFGLFGLLLAAGTLLASLLRWLLGDANTFGQWLFDRVGPLSVLVPFGMLWAYFGRHLSAQIDAAPNAPRRAALNRLYRTVVSLVGNIVTIAGLILLAQALVEPLWKLSMPSTSAPLATGLAALVVGLPLWLWGWTRLQAEARSLTEAGPQARHSVLRRGYLYLVIFLSLIGVMVMAGYLLFQVISLLLGNAEYGYLEEIARRALMLVIFAVWLTYHLRVLRGDGAAAERTQAARHAGFPVLVLTQGDDPLAAEVAASLQRLAPNMPVSLHAVESGAPDIEGAAAAVVIPGDLTLAPSDSLRAWLSEFTGRKVVIPTGERAVWAGLPPRSPADLAQVTARTLLQLSEGQPVRTAASAGGWVTAGYVLAVVAGLILLLIIFGISMSLMS